MHQENIIINSAIILVSTLLPCIARIDHKLPIAMVKSKHICIPMTAYKINNNSRDVLLNECECEWAEEIVLTLSM